MLRAYLARRRTGSIRRLRAHCPGGSGGAHRALGRIHQPPQSGDTYGVGERITVKVQWNEFVNIRGAASGFTGQPDPGFRMDGTLASGYIGVDYRPTK